jgi:riboflavin kinase / FMN adenylyltransferase
MKIIHAANELKPGNRKVCLAIGFFDGVHLGHQQIIRQAIADAHQHKAVALVLTFDCHPNTVVAPARVPPLIYSLPQKLRAISSLGVDHAWLVHFDKQFSEQSGEDFVRHLVRDLGPIRSICVGADFVFGHKRSGDVTLLKKLGGEFDFSVHGLAAVSLDGRMVSSTRIREAIQTNNLDAASQMLGRSYAICGKVMPGDQLGRQLGFPTANLEVKDLILPPNGVYAGFTKVKGRDYQAVLNIGFRPTMASVQPALRMEVHLLAFKGELYGAELEVEIGGKVRDEKKFASLSELREQIARDVAAVRSRV